MQRVGVGKWGLFLKKLVGARGFEPPASWSRSTKEQKINNLAGLLGISRCCDRLGDGCGKRWNPPLTQSLNKLLVMSSHILSPNLEADIWARLVRAHDEALSADLAKFLLSIDFAEEDEERMQELADRSSAGTLTSQERAEMGGYLHIANFLAVLQSNARVALKIP
jgi:hypothetical protein